MKRKRTEGEEKKLRNVVKAVRKFIADGSKEDNFEEIEKIVPRDFDFSLETLDPFICSAAENQKVKIVEWLLKKGANPNDRDIDNMTPLMLASDAGDNGQLVRVLLEGGADIHAIDYDGDTALHFAVYKFRVSISKVLLANGANIDVKNANFWSPFDYAQERDNPTIAHLIEDTLMEKLFSRVVVGGILSEGEFREFLADGVCDARILIHIANFAYH